jgi:hypothetical protein
MATDSPVAYLRTCYFSSKLCNFLSFLCFFFTMILVSDKCPMDGSNASDCKKNDGPDAIRTHDLRRVKAEGFGICSGVF